jgi:V/A-type H+/Na+-transporting ATPase subunit I
MLVPMAKVEIIGPKNRFLDVVSLLHSIGTMHIEDLSRKINAGSVPVEHMEADEAQLSERERLEGLFTRVRAVLGSFPESKEAPSPEELEKLHKEHWREDAAHLADDVTSIIEDVEAQTSSLTSRQSQIEQELMLLAKYEPILHKIQPLAQQIVTIEGFDSVALLIERRYKALLDELRDELDKITKRQCEIVSTDVDDVTTAAIVVFNKNYSEQVHKFLSMENVNQVRLPSDMADQPFDVAYDLIREKRRELPGELAHVRQELERYSEKWRTQLVAIRDVLADKIEEISAIPMFGQTDYVFVITGWVPVKDMAKMRDQLKREFGLQVMVEQLEIDDHDYDETPVALSNPRLFRPYQQLLSIFGPPKYGTIDPTWMLALFYPLFFGMIVGDIGYGLIMVGVAVWLRLKYRENQLVQTGTAVFGPAATLAIVFGFLYGEFFGNLLGEGGFNLIRPLHILGMTLEPFNREKLIMLLMVITVATGFVQVCLGLVLGAVNGVRTRHKSHVYEKGGLLLFLISLLVLAAAMVALAGEAAIGLAEWAKVALQVVPALGLLAGAFFAFKGGGILGGIELIGSISNIMSYIRIMAVGLAGAILAGVANGFATMGGKVSVIGVIAAAGLHALNIVIATFSPTIHALRLNFLEFFQKFYETGTQEYRPFHKTGGD